MAVAPRKLRDSWRQLRDGEPGRRFQGRYHIAGLFFLPALGPGILIVFAGGGLVAQESLLAARALDGIELRLRRGAEVAAHFWGRSSAPMRALVVALAVVVAGGAAYGSYQVFFAR